MPFTAAHPAIVLPFGKLSKRYVSLTALVVGSMVPDFEYFLRFRVKSVYSHTPWGLLYFDLPLGIILFLLYQGVIKNILIAHLPIGLRQRFWLLRNNPHQAFFNYNWLVVAVCLVTGAATHLFWDSFTHPHGWFVVHFPHAFGIVSLSQLAVPTYKLLQHGSTLVGITAIGFTILRLPKTTDVPEKDLSAFWNYFGRAFYLCFWLNILFNNRPTTGQFGNTIVTYISEALLCLLFTCLYMRYKTRF